MADIILVAAGSGKRMGADKNKLFLTLLGKPILQLTLEALQRMPNVERILPVIRSGDEAEYAEMLKGMASTEKIQDFVLGGKERSDSVRNGIEALLQDPGSEVIMVHDGARPFLTARLLADLQASAKTVGCAVPAMPVVDTTRHQEGGVTRVINRNRLFLVQTPQAFLRTDAAEVFLTEEARKLDLTDEASYFEEQERLVEIVQGEKFNVKLTRPEDLDWAMALIQTFDEIGLKDQAQVKPPALLWIFLGIALLYAGYVALEMTR